jgi:hypothetical protein
MTLGQKQELFSQLIAEHITWLNQEGYKVRGGDWYAKMRNPLEHKKDSLHYLKCALDINLFKDGNFLLRTEDHKASGEKWESRHLMCRWGGRYSDGNHYELLEWRI